MPTGDEAVRRLTHALLRPEKAVEAAQALRDVRTRAAIEGLAELLCRAASAGAALAALAGLEAHDDPLVLDALRAALDSPHPSVRYAAVGSLSRRRAPDVEGRLLRLLRQDASWTIRRAALRALADCSGHWPLLEAASDPHWRVRHALIEALLQWGVTEADRQEIDRRLCHERGAGRAGRSLEHGFRVEGVRRYLLYRWSGQVPPAETDRVPHSAFRTPHLWDWDAAVLARKLERMGAPQRRQAIDDMPPLLRHADERVRGWALDALRRWAEPRHLVRAVELLDEPRDGAGEAVSRLLASMDLDRKEETARLILHLDRSLPAPLAWAIDQASDVFPADEEGPVLIDLFSGASAKAAGVRGALARLASRWNHPEGETWLRKFLSDPDPEVQREAVRGLASRSAVGLEEAVLDRLFRSEHPPLRAEVVKIAVERRVGRELFEAAAHDPDARVRAALADGLAGGSDRPVLLARLQEDADPNVRAAALTPSRAVELVKDPLRETSWHVLARAARMARVPFWKLEPPEPWQTPAALTPALAPLEVKLAAPRQPRLLGPERLAVSPIGISGHYGLPVEGFVRAVESGVNLYFWEPSYQTLTEFADRLSVADRGALHFLSGTFEADGKRVRRDAERALRMLRIERLSIFLLFWVQSWDRIAPDVTEALERLRDEGKVGVFGLSTHSRPLAVEAMEAGWNPVMVRHSAAHRGAEECVLPRAVDLGTSIITFNNTCYGRLLEPGGGQSPASAADGYRYSLAQPGVTVTLSAPATLAELDENLAAQHDLDLPAEPRQRLLERGEVVYWEDRTFRKLVRSPERE